jgi:hypothetical protein
LNAEHQQAELAHCSADFSHFMLVNKNDSDSSSHNLPKSAASSASLLTSSIPIGLRSDKKLRNYHMGTFNIIETIRIQLSSFFAAGKKGRR